MHLSTTKQKSTSAECTADLPKSFMNFRQICERLDLIQTRDFIKVNWKKLIQIFVVLR